MNKPICRGSMYFKYQLILDLELVIGKKARNKMLVYFWLPSQSQTDKNLSESVPGKIFIKISKRFICTGIIRNCLRNWVPKVCHPF